MLFYNDDLHSNQAKTLTKTYRPMMFISSASASSSGKLGVAFDADFIVRQFCSIFVRNSPP